ncbi:MAG: DUF885 domain-containing protein [Acidobacteria bacterium]|nr:DUF885 domain-containing protein [Acidobacteriota bacterium]MCA1609308.1 DUF885 domain-containing protein [Acidobacteriota bacterium]
MSLFSIGLSAACVLLAGAVAGGAAGSPSPGAGYEGLLSFFREWREFQKPKVVGGVPDYGPRAMAAQQAELAAWRSRLAAIDPSGWPLPQQVDYHVVRAELNGLDFDHRVLKPWANNPAFYVTVFTEESDQPAREGPSALGAVEVWTYRFPLSAASAAAMDSGIRTIPKLLAQAKTNLTGNGKDLWIYGAKSLRRQSADLAALARQITAAPAAAEPVKALQGDVERARQATEDLAAWLEARAPSKTGSSGIGVDNYDWYLKNVQLVPGTWSDEVAIMERELARSHALLALEEQRNAKLPPQTPIANAEEHSRRFSAGVAEYIAFLRDHDILAVEDWMDPALRARTGSFSPGAREFFTEVDYRDPEVMRTHGYHWFDKGRMARRPHASPVRAQALLYNIFNTRTEGHATGWEEWMMQAGMFDTRPRSRELVYILLAERAARALGDLRMHSNEWTLEEASAFASAHTPRGWLRMDGDLVRGEQHLYLQQPGYGTSYVVGKIEIEKLLSERRQQLKDRFAMKAFMEEFDAAGLVPAALIRWELTGRRSAELDRMLK